MFEKRIREISENLDSPDKKKFYILTHKSHKREIYFRNKLDAIRFMKPKFEFFFKEWPYYFLRLGILQVFLKKIMLPAEFGDVIYVAGQVKGFDLTNKTVLSFPTYKKFGEEFVRSKEAQEIASKRGFAPKILEINKEVPSSKEELLKVYEGGRDKEALKKLFLLYEKEGIKEVPVRKYADHLLKKLNSKDIKNVYVEKVLGKVKKIKKKVLVSRIHGDFARENILIDKDGRIVFIDWYSQEGLVTQDLINIFRGEKEVLNNEEFKELIKMFPKEVRDNFILYALLSEISISVAKKVIDSVSLYRIKKFYSLMKV